RPKFAWPSTDSSWLLAPVKRLASIARARAPPEPPSIVLAVAWSCLSAPTNSATLPVKAFGKAENSTFIRGPSLRPEFSPLRPYGARRELRRGARDSISTGPQNGNEMTASALPKINVVGLGKLGAPLAAVLASRGFTVVGLDVNKT